MLFAIVPDANKRHCGHGKIFMQSSLKLNVINYIKFYPKEITKSFQIPLYCYYLCDSIQIVNDGNCIVSFSSNHRQTGDFQDRSVFSFIIILLSLII